LDPDSERLARGPAAAGEPSDSGPYLVDLTAGTVGVAYGENYSQRRTITSDNPNWPRDLAITNVEGVGFTLLAEHPGGIEVAGVVLLMAMLGAVVLARKKVELDEQAKLAAQEHALVDEGSAAALRATPRATPLHLQPPISPGNGSVSASEPAQVGGSENGQGAGRSPPVAGGKRGS
jgi:hypothetical protein